jgi:hypothetical protein
MRGHPVVLALVVALLLGEGCISGAGPTGPSGPTCEQICRAGTYPLPINYLQCRARCDTGTPQWHIDFWLKAYIPRDIPGYTFALGSGPFVTQTVIPVPPFGIFCSLTDQHGRSSAFGASARMTSDATFNVSADGISGFVGNNEPGFTTDVLCASGALQCTAQAEKTDMRWGSPTHSGSTSSVFLRAAASHACNLAAAAFPIRYEGILSVDTTRQNVAFTGRVTEFPAFESYVSVNGGPAQLLFYNFDSTKRVLALANGLTVSVSGSARLP